MDIFTKFSQWWATRQDLKRYASDTRIAREAYSAGYARALEDVKAQ